VYDKLTTYVGVTNFKNSVRFLAHHVYWIFRFCKVVVYATQLR